MDDAGEIVLNQFEEGETPAAEDRSGVSIAF